MYSSAVQPGSLLACSKPSGRLCINEKIRNRGKSRKVATFLANKNALTLSKSIYESEADFTHNWPRGLMVKAPVFGRKGQNTGDWAYEISPRFNLVNYVC